MDERQRTSRFGHVERWMDNKYLTTAHVSSVKAHSVVVVVVGDEEDSITINPDRVLYIT